MIFIVVSTGHFDALLEECSRLSGRFEFVGQIGSSTVEPPFPFFRQGTPDKIERHMREAELVISHGGTGMLSTLYRLRKPSVVVPKQKRYGADSDEQVELARKWGELKMSLLCMDVKDLQAAILAAKQFPYAFPPRLSLGKYLADRVVRDGVRIG